MRVLDLAPETGTADDNPPCPCPCPSRAPGTASIDPAAEALHDSVSMLRAGRRTSSRRALLAEQLVDRLAPRLGLRRLWVFERRAGAGAHAVVAPAVPATLCAWRDTDLTLEALAGLAPNDGDDTARLAMRLSRYRAQLARGDEPFVAVRGRQLLAQCWVAAACCPVPYLDAELCVAADTRYLYDAITHKAARGEGLMAALYAHVARVMALGPPGTARLLTLVRPSNRPMLAALSRAGFVRCGTLARVTPLERTLQLGRPALTLRPAPRR